MSEDSNKERSGGDAEETAAPPSESGRLEARIAELETEIVRLRRIEHRHRRHGTTTSIAGWIALLMIALGSWAVWQAVAPPAPESGTGATDAAGTEGASDGGPPPAEILGLPADAPAALVETAARAAEGSAEDQFRLAAAFATGDGVPQDWRQAARWFGEASSRGHLRATFNLGVLNDRGLGVRANPSLAVRLWRQAADGGDPDAQNALGLAYANGRGTEADPVQATRWFQAAAAAGNPRGAFNLGRAWEVGLLGRQDLRQAAGWYTVAAEAGDDEAIQALERVTPLLEETGDAPPEPSQGSLDAMPPVPETTPQPSAPAVPGAPPTEPGEATTPSPDAPGVPSEAEPQPLDRDGVRALQTALEALGYDPGPADGLMGPRTRTAIEAFERDRGLPVTGAATTSVLNAAEAARP